MRLSALVKGLSGWRGRPYVQQEMERRGFLVPREYQRFITDYCGINKSSGIETYWDEVAKEWICSRGWGNPDTRTFKGEHAYRSEYLDKLANMFDYKTSPFRNPSIHPCLHEFEKYCRASNDRPRIETKIEKEKNYEIEKFGLSDEGWTGLKKDVGPIFQKYLEIRGFLKRGNVFYKQCASGLIFNCWVDMGGRPNVTDFPLMFFIKHETDPDLTFEIGYFDILMPGFSYYKLFKTPQSAVLGVYAYAEIFDVLTSSFT